MYNPAAYNSRLGSAATSGGYYQGNKWIPYNTGVGTYNPGAVYSQYTKAGVYNLPAYNRQSWTNPSSYYSPGQRWNSQNYSPLTTTVAPAVYNPAVYNPSLYSQATYKPAAYNPAADNSGAYIPELYGKYKK